MLFLGALDRKVRWSSVVACWLNGLGFGLGLGQGTGNALTVPFFLWSYKCSEHLGLVVCKYATVYLWFHVT